MCQKQCQRNYMPYPRESHAGSCISEPVTSIDILIEAPAKPTSALIELMNRRKDGGVIPHRKDPVAYIVTNNRCKRYLVFAGSVEHENAQMFGYEMEALYA